jgi:tRNA (guanine-N7-)-methyltransferase
MGRRALRKVDPTLDLSRHLVRWEQVPSPWDPQALFGRTADLEIEVGSGKGLFLSSVAAAHPETDYLGIEIAYKYAEYAAARLARRGLPNARLLNGDAGRLLREILPADCLAAVHVYFPDPWWKARHRKRRIVSESFIRDVQRTLRMGGSLHFWTDVEEYFQTSLELLADFPALEGPLEVPELEPQHDLDYRTHFERRMRAHGKPVYRSEFRKVNNLPARVRQASDSSPEAVA